MNYFESPKEDIVSDPYKSFETWTADESKRADIADGDEKFRRRKVMLMKLFFIPKLFLRTTA